MVSSRVFSPPCTVVAPPQHDFCWNILKNIGKCQSQLRLRGCKISVSGWKKILYGNILFFITLKQQNWVRKCWKMSENVVELLGGPKRVPVPLLPHDTKNNISHYLGFILYYGSRFYICKSRLTHGVSPNARSKDPAIFEKISALKFQDCYVKIRSVDSHPTIGGGVVIQVSGELSNSGMAMRKFMQTFVLAQQVWFCTINDVKIASKR